MAGGCGGGQQCPRGCGVVSGAHGTQGWSERSRGTKCGWLFPGVHQWCPGVHGVAVDGRGMWWGPAVTRGTQGWPGVAMLRGAGNSQGCHEDVVRGWQCPRGHGCLGKTWSHWHHPGALGVAGTLLRGQGSPPDHPPMPAGGAAGLAAGAERGHHGVSGQPREGAEPPPAHTPGPPRSPPAPQGQGETLQLLPKKEITPLDGGGGGNDTPRHASGATRA